MSLEHYQLSSSAESPSINKITLGWHISITNKAEYINYFDFSDKNIVKWKLAQQWDIVGRKLNSALRNKDEDLYDVVTRISNTWDKYIDKMREDIKDNEDEWFPDPDYVDQSHFDKKLYIDTAKYLYSSLVHMQIMLAAYESGGIDGVKNLTRKRTTESFYEYDSSANLTEITYKFSQSLQKYLINNSIDNDVIVVTKSWSQNYSILDGSVSNPTFIKALWNIVSQHQPNDGRVNEPNKEKTDNLYPNGYGKIETNGYGKSKAERDKKTKAEQDALNAKDQKQMDNDKKTRENKDNRNKDTDMGNRSGDTVVTPKPKPSQPFYGQRQKSTSTFVWSSDTNRRISAPTTTVEQTNTLTPDMRRLYNDIVSWLNTISIDKLYMSYLRLQWLKSKLWATDQSRYSQTIGSLQAAIRTKVDSYIDDISSYDDNRQYQSQSIQRPQIESLLASYLSSYEPWNLDDDKRMITNLYVSLK